MRWRMRSQSKAPLAVDRRSMAMTPRPTNGSTAAMVLSVDPSSRK
ncbi:MAG TPA: hypothetical protein VEU08_05995 [Vicinamibacterales bacterium]|nr:hypothetical protein [Vicinamibacterales bacterium]